MARRKVIEWLIHRLEHEVDDRHFHMEMWLCEANEEANGILYHNERSIPYCKTAGCIAGSLFLGLPAKLRRAYAQLPENNYDGVADVGQAAQEQLGLSKREAHRLFVPDAENINKLIRQNAIDVLKRMLTHSEINWRAIVPEQCSGSTPTPITLTDD